MRPPISSPAPTPIAPAAHRRAMSAFFISLLPSSVVKASARSSPPVVPVSRVSTLGIGQCFRTVEAVVEFRVQMVGLVSEYRAKRAAVGREAPVLLVHVLAAGDRGGDGLIGVGRNAILHPCSVLPARGGAPVSERTPPLLILVVHEGQHGLFHIAVVGRAERFDERLAVPLKPHRGGYGQILAQRLHQSLRQRPGADGAGEGDLLHTETKSLKPDRW